MTTRTASAAQAHAVAKGIRVGTWCVTSTFSMGTGQSCSAGDVIQMIKVPANATLQYLATRFNYLDASCSVGDGLDADRYNATATRTVAQGWFNITTGTVPYTYTADDTIDITADLVSITTTVGGFIMTAIFSMDPGNYGPT